MQTFLNFNDRMQTFSSFLAPTTAAEADAVPSVQVWSKYTIIETLNAAVARFKPLNRVNNFRTRVSLCALFIHFLCPRQTTAPSADQECFSEASAMCSHRRGTISSAKTPKIQTVCILSRKNSKVSVFCAAPPLETEKK